MSGLTEIQHDVARFMLAAGQVIREHPTNLTPEEYKLRISLITEEFDETIAALIDLGDPPIGPDRRTLFMSFVADGVVDLIYVLVGTTLAMGIDLIPVWDEVQRANMAKMSGPVRDDGKRLKPDGWKPPDVLGIIREQQQEGRFVRPIAVGQVPLDAVRGWNCP